MRKGRSYGIRYRCKICGQYCKLGYMTCIGYKKGGAYSGFEYQDWACQKCLKQILTTFVHSGLRVWQKRIKNK